MDGENEEVALRKQAIWLEDSLGVLNAISVAMLRRAELGHIRVQIVVGNIP